MEYHLTSATCTDNSLALIGFLFPPGLTYALKAGNTTLQSAISRAGDAEEMSDDLWRTSGILAGLTTATVRLSRYCWSFFPIKMLHFLKRFATGA